MDLRCPPLRRPCNGDWIAPPFVDTAKSAFGEQGDRATCIVCNVVWPLIGGGRGMRVIGPREPQRSRVGKRAAAEMSALPAARVPSEEESAAADHPVLHSLSEHVV